jgi:hypothetical protein
VNCFGAVCQLGPCVDAELHWEGHVMGSDRTELG